MLDPRHKAPLFVSWALTNKCLYRCPFCKVWDVSSQELTSSQIYSYVDDLVQMGTKRISFTGGEPLLRKDIKDIIDYVAAKGVYVLINTNGALVGGKIEDIKKVNKVQLSLDGAKDVHDTIRGRGSYDLVLEAMELLNKRNIPFTITTVLNKENLLETKKLLGIAKDFSTKIIFQPATRYILGKREVNFFAPEKGPYREALAYLINEKQKGNPYIYNSALGLRHLFRWPEQTPMKCQAGRLFCKIEPDGSINPCVWGYGFDSDRTISNDGSRFRDLFEMLPRVNCQECWCAYVVEFNLISNFRIEPMLNTVDKNE